MSRRSSRLLSGGYYNSEDDSDSSSVMNVSYRENLVKIFKKKAGPRRTGSRTPSRAGSGFLEPEPLAPAGRPKGLSPSPLSRTETTTRSPRYAPYVSHGATPRPPLTSLTSRDPLTRGLPPARFPPGPGHKEPGPSGPDSSGYSSSEGGSSSSSSSSTGAPSTGYWVSVSRAVLRLMDSMFQNAAALQEYLKHHTDPAGDRVMKACALLLLLLVAALCVWFLPTSTSLISRAAISTPQGQPVLPAATPLLPPALSPHRMVDPAVVSAAVDERIRHVLAEQELKRQQLLSQVTQRLQLDLQDVRARLQLDLQDARARLQLDLQDASARLAAANSDEHLHLTRELSGLGGQMEDHRSTATVLGLRIQDLEAQNAKLSQEWAVLRLTPPPPAPEACDPPVQKQLTPELQQALEAWLTERLEQQSLKLSDGGTSSDCGRPAADKMADFALESQGASVISTRCSETYRLRSACVSLFGFPLWFPSESPRTVIQGYPVMLPGKCWAFHGARGTLVIALSHPVFPTHVTLDHLPRYNSPTGRIDSAPKDFEVYGMKDDVEEGTLLGSFRYDEEGEPTQTFRLPNRSHEVQRCVELRVLSNWGHVEYTCLYRFRVHGEMLTTP
ncbi:SUN domain-containing protein 2 isoform X2 [Clinocottus analis]|uniref:SUN domain-containing protein 2 isoform X2 n=1 Tax=Clinocottus analis TaxID=304258 RepID=UPI0035C04EA6